MKTGQQQINKVELYISESFSINISEQKLGWNLHRLVGMKFFPKIVSKCIIALGVLTAAVRVSCECANTTLSSSAFRRVLSARPSSPVCRRSQQGKREELILTDL